MAQIVTITNPLTGQPAQVDQLDHTAQQIDDGIARALPGGGIDTLLAGKAPAGFGLGGKYGVDITGSNGDANNAKYNGWYVTDESTANLPTKLPYSTSKEGTILTAVRGTQVKQIFFDNIHGYIATRLGNAGTGAWSEWEYVNPPMELGVEYRTTERYQGKPVYVKLVNFGALPNASKAEVYHEIPDINYIVSVTGTAKNTTDGWTFNFQSSPRLPYVSALMVSTESIVASTSVDWSKYNLYVTIKYTKATD